MECLAVDLYVRELYASGIERFALGPSICLLSGAFCFIGRVRKRENDWPLVQLTDRLHYALVETEEYARVRVPYAMSFAAARGIWLARFNRERRFP